MKRLLISLLGIAVVTACVRENIQPAEPGAENEAGGMHAYIVNPDTGDWMPADAGTAETRTDFDGYVGKFAWSDGDKIAIHLSDGTFYETPVNAETGEFTCSTTSSKQRDAYAIYPASARDADNYGSPTLKVVLPAEYDISGNTASDYTPVPMVAVNRQGEDDLYFRHVGSLFRINCNRIPADTRYLAVTFDRNVAGSFPVVDPASDHPTLGEGGNSATVTFRIAVDKLTARTDGIVLNVPVPTGDYSLVRVAALRNNRTEIRSSERNLAFSLPRAHGKKLVWNVIPAYYDSMQMVITADDEKGMTFHLPFRSTASFPADLQVEWGDGSSTFIHEGPQSTDEVLMHTYSAAGDYTITLTAVASSRDGYYIPEFRFEYIARTYRDMLKSVPTPLLHTNESGNHIFYQCQNLVSVCGDLFSKNPQFSSFAWTFADCKSLQGIPEGLFDNNPLVKSFFLTFYCCTGLTGPIPETLFAHNPLVTTFKQTFYCCNLLTGSIPEKLFANNPLVTTFEYTFNGCTGLTGPIPGGLFSNNPEVTTFYSTFRECRSLTGPLPANLFANNGKVTSFCGTFDSCLGLDGRIPGQLFANNAEVISFENTFASCESLTGSIPAELFAHNPLVQYFSSVFAGCKNLSGLIPSGLFAHNPEVTSFRSSFNGCSSLTGIPAGLFANHHEVTSFENTFSSCHGISAPLPEDIFSGCEKVTSFRRTFSSCSSLRCQIPGNLFADCPEVTSFENTFSYCHNLAGPIPATLFANNTKVTTFESVFRGCSQTTGDGTLPAGFFANNPLAVNFAYAFWECMRMKPSADMFTSGTVTSATRFASVTAPVNFTSCFNNIGVNVGGGVAPALWEFTFPEGLAPVTTGCFGGATSLTNWADIDPAWK